MILEPLSHSHFLNQEILASRRELGDGMVFQLAIPLDASWSNLPARAAFLPFIQQITTHLASRMFSLTIFPQANL